MAAAWASTRLWEETCAIPATLAATLERGDATPLATLLRDRGTRRVVATGNGAAYYAAQALWLASLAGRPGPEVVAVPAGLVARGRFPWRTGDVLLAVSSSGEMRDVIEALDADAPRPFAAVSSSPGSTIATRADALARVVVSSQDAVTHTQAFCGNVAALLAAWAEATDDGTLADALGALPGVVERACAAAAGWADALGSSFPAGAVVFGSGPAWAAALEGALLLKEVAGVRAEGVETREGATSAMYALTADDLVVSVPTGADPLLDEAEAICAARGAAVVRAPGAAGVDPRLAAVAAFPGLVALAARLGAERGLDLDRPAWTDAYYAVARGPA